MWFKSRGAIRAVIEALLAPDGLTLQGAIGRQLTRRHKKVIFALQTETLAQQKQCVRIYSIIMSTADRQQHTHSCCRVCISCPHPAVVKQSVFMFYSHYSAISVAALRIALILSWDELKRRPWYSFPL